MRKLFNLVLGPLQLGDVFVGRDPPTVDEWLIDDLESTALFRLHDCTGQLFGSDVLQDI